MGGSPGRERKETPCVEKSQKMGRANQLPNDRGKVFSMRREFYPALQLNASYSKKARGIEIYCGMLPPCEITVGWVGRLGSL
jgi:hypothetical protein